MLSRMRRWISHLAAVGVVVGLGTVASAGLVDPCMPLIIVAPSTVVGGQPIVGYVAGSTPDTLVEGFSMGVPVQGSPDAPGGDPNYFNFPTTEAMAPTTVMILAHNNSFSITALVYVL